MQGDRMLEFLQFLLQTETSEKAQSLVCMGLSKLLLSGIVTDEKVRNGSTLSR